MALYAYKAMNTDGRIVLGRLDAINPIDLELRLKRMDLDFIKGSPVKQSGMFGGKGASRRECDQGQEGRGQGERREEGGQAQGPARSQGAGEGGAPHLTD